MSLGALASARDKRSAGADEKPIKPVSVIRGKKIEQPLSTESEQARERERAEGRETGKKQRYGDDVETGVTVYESAIFRTILPK